MTKLTTNSARALRIDLASMEAEFTDLEARITAVRLLLNGSTNSLKKPKRHTTTKTTGLAKMVKKTLADFPRGVSPGDLAITITNNGFQWHSNAPLIRSVNSELYRMSKSKTGDVKHMGRGKYRLKVNVEGETTE